MGHQCYVHKLVTGRFDPTVDRAVWPSTGNYCRGGAYDSNLLACESIAILPEGMSKERFDWLASVAGEVIKTPGSESNVKEIFDKCWELRATGENLMIFNQFDEFGNPCWHYAVTVIDYYSRYLLAAHLTPSYAAHEVLKALDLAVRAEHLDLLTQGLVLGLKCRQPCRRTLNLALLSDELPERQYARDGQRQCPEQHNRKNPTPPLLLDRRLLPGDYDHRHSAVEDVQ